ncbi:unnamed protein product, partial [Rotaria sordida]
IYLEIVKGEFEFQKERLQKLIDDFPQDRYEVPSTQIDDDGGEEPLDNEVFTQKSLSQRQETINNQKGSELFKKYIGIAHKRAQLEIEREVHFLSERGVQETPVGTQEPKDLNPVMRVDFLLQTKAYQDLGTTNPLESLVERTNNFLYGLWYNKHITQKQYEKLKVNKEKAELAHLYFLPKAHKPGTPLRPIMSGLKSPTIEISRWLDSLLRSLFDRLAINTTVKNGLQLIQQVERWSATYLTPATSFVTMDVTDLYTMIPQEGGVTAIKKLMEAFGLKQIDGVKKEIILALTRFVINNNYFYLDGSYYKQIRGGAMGSPLTLTIANAYMYFVERPISKWANKTCSLYFRYIDDLFIMSNVHADILKGLNTIEMYQQQQQQQRQNNLPSSSYSIPNGIQLGRQYQYGYQQQPMVYQPYGIDSYNMPLNWQFQNNWMGDAGNWINGQQQMPLQSPPFYYPIDNNVLTTVVPSLNQVQYKDNEYDSVMPSKRRGILKIRKEPTQRRLVHFMPENWQKKTKPDNRGYKPDQLNNRGRKQKTKKSPEEAHLDTLRRRARRQKQRAALLEKSNKLDCFKDNNRFTLLSEIDDDNINSEADKQTEAMINNNNNNNKMEQKTNLSKKQKNRQARTTTEVPIIDEHVVNNNKKTRGNTQRQINFSDSEKEEENYDNNDKSPSLNKDKRKCKSYLQTFKILAYLKDRVNKDNKIKLDIKDVFNEVCEFAKNTIETYDSWVRNHYEAQVWQHIYDLGKEKDHWAKEIVNITHTREAKINVSMCEKKLAQLTSTCFDANNLIKRNMRELSSKTATVAVQ